MNQSDVENLAKCMLKHRNGKLIDFIVLSDNHKVFPITNENYNFYNESSFNEVFPIPSAKMRFFDEFVEYIMNKYEYLLDY